MHSRLCPECGASFPSPLKLSVHMATVHDSSQTSVVCDQCGKWFPHPNKLMRHKYSHHNNKKLLECHACDKVRLLAGFHFSPSRIKRPF